MFKEYLLNKGTVFSLGDENTVSKYLKVCHEKEAVLFSVPSGWQLWG